MPTRRSPSTLIVVIGCALVAAVLVAVGFVAFDIGGNDGDATSSDAPVAEETAAAPTEERLTAESRLGYAGLGPITLGMSKAGAERSGRMTIEPSDGGCSFTVTPEAGSGLGAGDVSVWFGDGVGVITVNHPAIRTISGVHVGSTADDVFRTYSNAVEAPEGGGYSVITITSADGRFINFYVDPGRLVTGMLLSRDPDVLEGWSRC
jgi:hypothetical protein